MRLKQLLALLLIFISAFSYAQQSNTRLVTGTVKDEKGNILPSITVTEKTTSNAVVTNDKGAFSIRVKEKNTMLIFTGIGFEAQTISVGSQTTLNIMLKDDVKSLNDVVVVGYGSQKKAKVTGAVATVKMDEILGERPVSTTATLLQGVTPGLQVTLPSGRPGEGASLNIRGATGLNTANNSITSGSPLILVDNTVFQGPLNLIDPNDIETVTVLKDAGAAAIYGGRSSYGVILIQTKKGIKNQKPQFNFSNNTVFATPDNLPQKATPQQSIQALIDGGLTNYTVGQGQDLKKWIQFIDEYEADPSKYPNGYRFDGPVYYNLKGNKAVDELLGNSSMQVMNNLSVSGGSDKTTYRLSFGATNEKGILMPEKDVDNFKRYNVKSVLTTDVTNWMNVLIDASYSNAVTTRPGYADPFTYAVRIPSFLTGDSIPNYPGLIATGKNLVDNSYPTKYRYDQLRLTAKVVLKPFAGMTITGENTFDNYHALTTSFGKQFILRDPYGWNPQPYGNDQFQKNNEAQDYNSLNLFAAYTKALGRHNVSAMAGFNQETKNYEQEILSKTQIINPDLPSISAASGDFSGLDNYSQFATMGYFGRFNYDFDSKYLLELNGRYDGSSRFPFSHRWGFFPSASAGWRIMNEKFMAFAKPYFSELKLRASYGSVGNQNIAEYQFIAPMSPSNPSWFNSGKSVVTLSTPGLISPNFTWEEISTMDFGVSYGMLKNRLTGELDWYTRETKGILSRDNTPTPAVLGASAPLVNSASMKSKGFEVELNWRDKIGKKVNYYVSANLYDFTSTVTKVDNPNNLLSQLYVGQKLGEMWGYVTDRFYTVDDFIPGTLDANLKGGVTKAYAPKYGNQSPNPGDIMYVDLDSNGLINAGANTLADHGDKRIIGNSSLRYQFGFRGGISFANFDFSFVLSGVLKNDQFRSSYLFFPNNWQVYGALYKNQLNYWTPNNPDAYFGRIYTTTPNGSEQPNNEILQTRFVLNGAYVRVRNLSLRYNIPNQILERVKLKRLSISYSIENPIVFHHLPNGMYPDVNDLGGGLAYPLLRKSSVGINLNF
ncbi:TonB-dependent receptor [Chitinophagaceae bacterium LB-8]|uniref:TonB-dependent receptor n=1 Tax=Paraflavisolibacter caeni TaxID=2982496 RepID=A0A9X3B7T5_9BACT|nr:TonB-dependent receptor [Paraflavisolibacter caeni]MCU7548826.1 TonB-dependent receptor [Paraflavisolibacter caeni]